MMLVAQVAPVYPDAHAQTTLLTPSVQMPSLRHDDEEQSLILVAHVTSWKPEGQTHANTAKSSVQLPPLTHGDEAHSLMSLEQSVPV